jgi:type I restriction enzyme S subunit
LIEGPSIIIGRKGTVGQVTYVQTNNWPIDTTFYVNINSEMLLMKYAYYLLANANLPILAQGAAVPGLNRNDVYAIKVPLPSKNEQAQIITFIEKFEKQKEKLLSNKDRLNVLKKKLTDEFLSGNLKIPLEALQNVQ